MFRALVRVRAHSGTMLIASAVAAGLVAGAVASGVAQSLTSGTLAGVVQDSGGVPIYRAEVSMKSPAWGVSRAAVTPRSGRFAFEFLAAGEYDVLVEQLGYQPQLVRGVPIRPGRVSYVVVVLPVTAGPVNQPTIVPFAGAALHDIGTEWFAPFEIVALPGEDRAATSLGRYATTSSSELQTEGLPGWLSGLVLDGIRFTAARHPGLGTDPLAAALIPLSALGGAELVTNGADAEWSGAAGGYLSAYTRRSPNRLQARVFADWSGDAVSDSKYFDTGTISNSTWRGGIQVGGPVIRDTAHFVVGVEAQRLETPRPRGWVLDSLDGPLLATARDSFNVDLEPYVKPRVARTDVIAGFGRFDWQIASAHALSVRANVASISGSDADLGPGHIPTLGVPLDGIDLSAAATLTSTLSRRVAQEFRLGAETTTRDYGGVSLPGTSVAEGGLAFGADPTLPGRFRRIAVLGSETLHLAAGMHRFKLGAGASVAAFEQRYEELRSGEFAFASVDELARRRGAFTQSTGPVTTAKFSVPSLAAYVQDTWTAAPGFDLSVGLRYELERLPRGNVERDTAWLQRTGLDNTSFPNQRSKVSPRMGLVWDVGRRHRWIVHAEAGIHFGTVDPGLLGELVTHAGRVETRRGFGDLGQWPMVPDSAHAPVQGPNLTLLGPDFQPPRSSRLTVGLSQALGRGAGLHISGSYRHTDFLPRRHDLNLLPAPSGFDQYGRPLYGTLQQEGGLLGPLPGSNRRFPGFDRVSALDGDGFSDYWGVTATLERHLGGPLRLLASYTYSKTTDNWLSVGGPALDAQLTPFPDSVAGVDWAEGRSDFDVPHRAVIAAEVAIPGRLGIRLAGFYRYRSGFPFTPGFRDGVDANGDGSARNDPAFVDDTIGGIAPLLTTWGCLRTQVGRFAERNSCREPGVHRLDLRVTFGLLGRFPAEVVVDALNLLESDIGVLDHALYLVDGRRTLVSNPVTGVTTVPLVANPNFGKVLTRRTSGRAFRIGFRVNY